MEHLPALTRESASRDGSFAATIIAHHQLASHSYAGKPTADM